MKQLDLSFVDQPDVFSVRRFSVREGLSQLFELEIEARSPADDVDFESFVGRPVSFRITGQLGLEALGEQRRWRGVCSYLEQTQTESRGLSTYAVRIVPELWLLTQRRNHRIFQHLTIPDIVDALLREWGIRREWKIDRERHPEVEYRVQYGETDFAFLHRLLEESGISFGFVEHEDDTVLVLSDAPHVAEPLLPGPIAFDDRPAPGSRRAFVTRVRLAHEVRPGKCTVRDFDFRARPDHGLYGSSVGEAAAERPLEQYHYLPGSFVDDKGSRSATERHGHDRASLWLEGARATKRRVKLQTNLVGLAPGVVFSISGHAHPELHAERRLLVTGVTLEGTHDGEWVIEAQAAFADFPYRTATAPPKPVIHGVQSALVVGPAGQDVHVDEFGRVRVQFHWDREGEHDDNSSCWIRVSQGWAGAGFGMIALPRVAQEVLVGFFEGDPDQPVIVGRMFNAAMRVPYDLPENKAVSGWKSNTTPGSGGFNEIRFDDANGAERVAIQAERNLEKLTKVDETEVIGRNHAVAVGANRISTVGAIDATSVGVKHSVHVALPAELSGTPSTHFEMIDKRIHLSTGEASLTLEGPNIILQAKGVIQIRSAEDDVVITGGPWVKINCDPPELDPFETVTYHHLTGILRDQDGEPLPGRRLLVKSSEGVIQDVCTDASGRYLAIVAPGPCEVTVPGDLRYGQTPDLAKMTLDPEVLQDSGSMAR